MNYLFRTTVTESPEGSIQIVGESLYSENGYIIAGVEHKETTRFLELVKPPKEWGQENDSELICDGKYTLRLLTIDED